MPFVSELSGFLQKIAPKSRRHLFVDDEKNSKASMSDFEELLSINSSVIDVYLQVYGDEDLVDPCICIFRRYSSNRMHFS